MTEEERVLSELLLDLKVRRAEAARRTVPQPMTGMPVQDIDALERIDTEIYALILRQAQVREAHSASARQADVEDSAFWFRRFFTSIAIANGAAFVALAAGFLQADDRKAIATLLPVPMTAFAVGMFASGAIPIVLWIQIRVRNNEGKLWPNAQQPLDFITTGLIGIALGVSVSCLVKGIASCIRAISGFA